ncbi:rRNA biogenesis protein [Halovivax ruber XH-70]|uniref:rRNA biogenesis protein n=1 Tax=Halovivax ruber (strain DSM 18193 / JCM 13892 / XH-70) TaxID=797302 RepID=L0IBA4_HALRX|nr:NOP5/NOP56 family protein [Halovivax ruber]AGB16039.1 rRNA biogenesis protein [Halovivax ruber XH-70]
MSDRTGAWFEDVTRHETAASATAIRSGSRAEPAPWPELAVESGAATDEDDYYDWLHDATVAATADAAQELERADDRQLVHAVRAMDDCRRTANELAERLAEWGGTVDDEPGTGVAYARRIVAGETAIEDETITSLAERVVDLEDEALALEDRLDRVAPTVAPNLVALADPVLAARLISLAGSLEALAKQPSGTIQVLGAEDALFAHLRGHAPSPKHGVIYTHEAVRGTAPANRGSAARAVAGKLAIAARVDHYAGDRRPDLERELAERIETIQARDGATESTEAGTDD